MAGDLVCYYCGERRAITRDHVPGRWLAPRLDVEPWPTAPLCRRCKRATEVADAELRRLIVAGDAPATERSKRMIGRALDKLARGLQWIHDGSRVSDDALSLWEHRTGPTPFAFAGRTSVAAFSHGPDFTWATGADRFGSRWHVSFLGRVHFAISYLDVTAWWSGVAARAARAGRAARRR